MNGRLWAWMSAFRHSLSAIQTGFAQGGVGKTTAAVNYAWYLANKGLRTLLIDTDSQGSVGVMLNLKAKTLL
jgi:chromosome partitioning protein